ncbi:sensor histidine kinase [Archangium lansingense]|uniref:histidine kinase n=1 Tax=Archangium lansingense TaxID=2995310 RepID=A0ABT4ANP9_9BACT|nr:ATP-binding protein [Archangium lansinium]MCY1082896.1 ATP-binding protein [Archangium lansinium]
MSPPPVPPSTVRQARPLPARPRAVPFGRWGPRRKMLLVLAPALLSQYGLDVLAVGPGVWTFVIRLVWALSVALSALWMDEHSAPSVRLHTAFQCTAGSLCFIALVFVTGGSGSVYFNLFPCIPLVLCLLYPQDSLSATLSGALCSAGAAGLLWGAGHPVTQSLLWAGMVVTVTVVGAYGASEFRKAQRAENEGRLERARREALETLAISERRRAHSEKLATIGQLAASVMHEINNPVAFIGANLDFLEREVLSEQRAASREELAEVFRETRTGVERVRQIIGDLRGFSRMDAEVPTECALADVVSDAVRIARLRLQHVARLEVDIPAELPPVLAVRRRLAQVLLNLLVNAGDALEARGREGSEVRILGGLEGSRVVLRVEDNGPGFPPHVLSRLFETFFTTKGPEKGTGLGLALSREMVEQFGGTLRAENREEGGARLRLEFPVGDSTRSPS